MAGRSGSSTPSATRRSGSDRRIQMSGASRLPAATVNVSPATERSHGPPAAPATLTRSRGTPAGARQPAAAKACGNHRSKSSAGVMSGGGLSQLSVMRATYDYTPPRPHACLGQMGRCRNPGDGDGDWRFLGLAGAFGQASDPDLRPTRGPFITGGMRAGTGDATDTELNPAALALMPASDAEIVGGGGGAGRDHPAAGRRRFTWRRRSGPARSGSA